MVEVVFIFKATHYISNWENRARSECAIKKIIAANNGKMPVKGSTAI